MPCTIDKEAEALASTAAPSRQCPQSILEPKWPKGWRPWLSLFGCFLKMWNSWGLVNSYGTFASYYQQHLLPGRDLFLWNLVGSTQCFIVLACSFFIGRLSDAGHSRTLVALGGFLITLGMFLLSVVNGDGNRGEGNYGLIWLTQGFIQSLGMSCLFVPSSQVAATWFPNRKPTAVGIVACGASIAGLVYPTMLSFMIELLGFNNAVRATAGLVGFTSLISFLTAKPNPAHTLHKPTSWKKVETWADPKAFQYKPFWWLTASICFMFFGHYAVFFNLEGWAAKHGFGRRYQPPGLEITIPDEQQNDSIDTFWLLAIANVASTVGRTGSAGLAERFGTLTVHISAMTLSSILCLALWTQADSLAPALAFLIIFGAVSGAVIGMPPASMAWVLHEGHPDQANKLGHWIGMMYTACAPFALTGPVIAGHLISEYGERYITVQLWSGICYAAGALCMFVSWYYTKHGQTSWSRWKDTLSGRSTGDVSVESPEG